MCFLYRSNLSKNAKFLLPGDGSSTVNLFIGGLRIRRYFLNNRSCDSIDPEKNVKTINLNSNVEPF